MLRRLASMRRAALMAACALLLCASRADRAVAQQCPANAHHTDTTQQGAVRTIHCTCNDGYTNSQGQCRLNATLLSLQQVTGGGVYYLQLSDGRRLTGQRAQQVPLDEAVVAVTGPDSHVTLTLSDGATFTIGADARIELDRFVYDPDPSLGNVTARVIKGVFRYITGRTSPYKKAIIIPAAVTGVRGTEFEGFVSADGSGYLKLYSGQLSIEPVNGTPAFLLEAGQMISFTPDKTVKGPMTF